MKLFGKLALVPPLLLGAGMGLLLIFDPSGAIAQLGGMEGTTPVGDATIRADLAAFFLTAAIASLCAIVTGRRDYVWVPMSLFGFAALIRTIEGFQSGFATGAASPIIIETVMVALCVFAIKALKPRY